MISIIVAVKNDVVHIEKCIDSIENQDFADYEIIVVDGQSTDGTLELLEKRLANNNSFILMHNPKGNAAAGRNIGIKKARGQIVAFLDSDAYANKDWLFNIESRFSYMNNTNIAGVGGPNLPPANQPFLSNVFVKVMASPLASGGRFNPSIQHKMLKDAKLVKHIPTCNLAIKRNIFCENGWFDERFTKGHDFELSMRLNKKGYLFFYDPEIKVWHYRKPTIRSFAKQIFEWGQARMLLMKKHGLSFNCLLPLFFLLLLMSYFILSIFYPLNKQIVAILIYTYIFAIFLESARISSGRMKMYFYGIFLLPVIHISYTVGLTSGIFKKLRSTYNILII